MEKRNSRIELLRMLSMFFIVLSHYTVHNGIKNFTLPLGPNRFLLETTALGNLGVIIFVLIMGYFSINQKEPFKLKKMILLILETFFYSAVIYTIFILLDHKYFSIKLLIKSLFPITFKEYWFMTTYIVLYIFTPYLNKLINSMTKKENTIFLNVGILLFSIINTLSTQNFYGNELIQFILFYSLGAYLNKYKDNFFSKKKNSLITMIISIIILISSVIIMDLLGTKYSIFGSHSTYLFRRTSIICILLGTSIFSLFNLKETHNKFINILSSSVLGIYLISDNNYIRKVLWTDILKVYSYIDKPSLIIHMIISVLGICIICLLIDLIRKHTIEKLISKLYDYIESKIKRTKLN